MKTIAAAAAFGVAAAVITALTIARLVPQIAHESTEAVVESIPFGLFVGVLMGGFLSARGRRALTFRRIWFETIVIAIIAAIVASQLVLPVTGGLPRLQIASLIVISAAVLAGIGARLLRPLYWRRSNPTSDRPD